MDLGIIRPLVRRGKGWAFCRSLVTPKQRALEEIKGWGKNPAPFGWHWYFHIKTATMFLVSYYDTKFIITEQEWHKSRSEES